MKNDESLYVEGCLLKTGGYQPIGKDDDLPLNPPNTGCGQLKESLSKKEEREHDRSEERE